MTADASNLAQTIVPKSDQLNADDLLTGPLTVTVTGVQAHDSADQPVSVHIAGHRPYKPCKSMRRVLITAWGVDGRAWAGRSMTLYCDPEVMFGGIKVGGIRISHLSHIDRELAMSLTATRGKKANYKVKPLTVKAAAVEIAYPEYEAANLAGLQSAAMLGSTALREAFGALPKSANKAALWEAHGDALKKAADAADSTGSEG
jgi:hypothetical protein